MDSATVLGVAERVAEGKLSVAAASEFAGNLNLDGATKVGAFVLDQSLGNIHCNFWERLFLCVFVFNSTSQVWFVFFLGNTWNLKPLHPIFGFVFKILQRHVQVSVKQLAASRERDFFRWVKLPLPIYKACVPVKLDAGATSNFDGRGTAEISMILPSDHLAALHQAGERVPSQHGFFSVLTYLHDCFIVSPPYCCHRTFELCATRSGNA